MTTLSEDVSLSLFDVSTKLGMSPSAIKKRVAHLNIPVKRGARGKLIFDRAAYGLLAQADEMLKAGHGFDECRRALGLEAPTFVPDVTPGEGPELVAVVERAPEVEETPVEAPEAVAETVAASVVEPVAEPVAEVVAPELLVVEAPRPVRPVTPEVTVARQHPVPQPVVIQLAKRKQAQAAAASADPETLGRLDSALKLLEEKEKQNQMLQSKLLVAYDEMTKLSATAAAFQERSLNLQHEVNKLQGEMRLLAAPQSQKPWWKFWG